MGVGGEGEGGACKERAFGPRATNTARATVEDRDTMNSDASYTIAGPVPVDPYVSRASFYLESIGATCKIRFVNPVLLSVARAIVARLRLVEPDSPTDAIPPG